MDRKKTITELEELASKVLSLKQERGQRRPLLIEFCGSPKSGKTTTITSLNIFLKRNGFKTVLLTERASICPIENKRHPFFNIWTLTSAISEILENLEHGKDKIDVIICDRGIFDALCWFTWLNTYPSRKSPYLDDDSYDILTKFIRMDIWRKNIDLIYVFSVKPDTSIVREYSNLLTEKRGSIMQETILKEYNDSIGNSISKFGSFFRKIEQITTDTDETNNLPNIVSYKVTTQLLNNLQDLLIEKIGYLDDTIKNAILKKKIHDDLSLFSRKKLKFENRNVVEEDLSCIQPIVIAVITNKERNQLLIVKKNPKKISKNSQERDKILCYIGGHSRIEDRDDPNEDIFKTMKQTLHREIQEEIGESLSIRDSRPFIICTPDGKRNAQHFAICYTIEMDLENKKFKLTSDEFTMKTGKSKSGNIVNVNDVYKMNIDTWSEVIIEKIFKMKIDLDLF